VNKWFKRPLAVVKQPAAVPGCSLGYVLSGADVIERDLMTVTPRVLGTVIVAMALGATATACSASATPAPGTSSSAGAHRAPPTGTVTVKDGNKVVCVMTIKAGKGTCKVSTKTYAPGTLRFDATYSGGSGYKPSHGSATVKLVGPKAG
jgi:hypothetical protein